MKLKRSIADINALTKQSTMVKVLKDLQRIWGYKSAVIAGGVIRDMFLNKTPTDIDIFLWDPQAPNNLERSNEKQRHITESHIHDISRTYLESELTPIAIFPQMTDSKHYRISPYVSQVWEVVQDQPTERESQFYQFVFLNINPVEYVTKYFDIGICKTYCDGKRIHFTSDFLNDVNNQTLTICGQDMTQRYFDRVVDDHLQRLREKFPTFTPKVSPHNIKFVDEDSKWFV